MRRPPCSLWSAAFRKRRVPHCSTRSRCSPHARRRLTAPRGVRPALPEPSGPAVPSAETALRGWSSGRRQDGVGGDGALTCQRRATCSSSVSPRIRWPPAGVWSTRRVATLARVAGPTTRRSSLRTAQSRRSTPDARRLGAGRHDAARRVAGAASIGVDHAGAPHVDRPERGLDSPVDDGGFRPDRTGTSWRRGCGW
jgi:hypothetical protein